MRLPTTRVMVGGLAAAAAALVLGSTVIVSAQTTSQGSTPPSCPWAPTVQDGAWPSRGGPYGHMMGGPGFGRGGMAFISDAVLKTLGMSADQLVTELQNGKSLAQLAQEKGVSKDALVAGILEQHQRLLDSQVQSGWLTPAQATAMQSVMRDRVSWMVEQKGDALWSWCGPSQGAWPMGPGRMGPGMRPWGPRR